MFLLLISYSFTENTNCCVDLTFLSFGFLLFHCIDLIIPPSFTKKLKKMNSIKGSFIDLECIVAGSHPISIQWFKDDQEITASEKYKFSFHDNTAFLEISQLEGTDSGTYTCSATNKAGHNQCSGHLTVKGWHFLSPFIKDQSAVSFLNSHPYCPIPK